VQLYRYFMSQSSKFCSHNPLCCFSTSVHCYKCIFRYRLGPETFGYTLIWSSFSPFCYFLCFWSKCPPLLSNSHTTQVGKSNTGHTHPPRTPGRQQLHVARSQSGNSLYMCDHEQSLLSLLAWTHLRIVYWFLNSRLLYGEVGRADDARKLSTNCY
jgi:hypothetical protein